MNLKDFFNQYKKPILYWFIFGMAVLIAAGAVWWSWSENLKVNNIETIEIIKTNLCGPEPPVICGTDMRLTCINGKWDCREIEEKIDISDWKTYRNEEIGFEFSYPLDYLFEITKDYKGSDWRFDLTSPRKEILIINREDNRFPELDTFEKFALDRSEASCAADGHDGSVYCANENKKTEFTNPAGIVGYEIYLNEITEDYTTNQKTTRIKGPIFVLDFSPLNNPDARGIFFNREDTFSEREIIVQILSTFKFIK